MSTKIWVGLVGVIAAILISVLLSRSDNETNASLFPASGMQLEGEAAPLGPSDELQTLDKPEEG